MSDPVAVDGSKFERLNAFRQIRDDLRQWIAAFVAENEPK